MAKSKKNLPQENVEVKYVIEEADPKVNVAEKDNLELLVKVILKDELLSKMGAYKYNVLSGYLCDGHYNMVGALLGLDKNEARYEKLLKEYHVEKQLTEGEKEQLKRTFGTFKYRVLLNYLKTKQYRMMFSMLIKRKFAPIDTYK